MPKLTLDQLQTLEALTGKHHSIVDGKPRKTLRTEYQSYKLGLMIWYTDWDGLDQLKIQIGIYEKILGYESTNYESRLKLELLLKRYEPELTDKGYRIKKFNKLGNYELQSIKTSIGTI